jgi:hypothetical protein
MTPLESFAGGEGFGFNTNEQSMSFENSMNGSLGTREVELVLDTTGAPCRISLFEPNNSSFQRQRYCMG